MSRKTSILSQLIIGFSIILVLILTVTSFFYYRYSSRVVVEKTSQYLLESVVQMRGKTDVMLLEYDRLSQKIAFSSNVQQHFIDVKLNNQPETSKASINRFIADQSRYSGSEMAVHLLDLNGGSYSGNESLAMYWRTEEKLHQVDWYPAIEENVGRMIWLSGPAWRNGTISAVIGARQLNNWSTLDKIGDMFLVFTVDSLRNVIEETIQDRSRKIHIIDYRGNIVYSTVSDEIGKPMESGLFEQMKREKTDLVNWDIQGVPAYVAYSTSTYSGWTIASYIEAADAVKDLKKIQNSALIIGLFGIGAALLLTTFFSWSVSKPIRNLALRLSRVQRGVLNPYRGRIINQEVTILYDSFNNMVENLNETILDLSSKQATEKQAQIIALKAQFRPHFLYNSLNTIYWELMNEGQDKAAQMVLTLSDLMRYSIQPGSDLVTIQEDLDQLNRYLLLQRARFGDKLQVTIEADEPLMQQKVMKMLLQPLVENAITHGLETVKGRPWLIRIEIKLLNDHILLAVEDNGKGMTEEDMANVLELRKDADAEKTLHTGLGLANLHQRIRLIYGLDNGLKLLPGSMNGLRVEIMLPLNGGNWHGDTNHS